VYQRQILDSIKIWGYYFVVKLKLEAPNNFSAIPPDKTKEATQ
jgi:hypothetical protein